MHFPLCLDLRNEICIKLYLFHTLIRIHVMHTFIYICLQIFNMKSSVKHHTYIHTLVQPECFRLLTFLRFLLSPFHDVVTLSILTDHRTIRFKPSLTFDDVGSNDLRSVTMMLPCRNIMRSKSLQRIGSLQTAIPISGIFLSYSME